MSSEMDKESWNKFAKQYDKMTLLWPGYFASVDRILELASPSPDMVALDVGCGTGALALKLAPRCKRVIGVDISSKMLEIARGKAENLGIKNVEFKEADARKIPLDNESVDIIVSNIALHHLQDDQKSLAARELFRVLSLDGCIVLGDPATREKHRWLARKKAWVQHMRNSNWPARLKIAGFAIKWAFYFSFINRLRPMEFIITGEEWMKILDNAGFRDLKCDYSDPLVNVIYGEKHK